VSKETSATRYAKAIFGIAVERNELARWQSDLTKIATLDREKMLTDLLENPTVRSDVKIKILAVVLSGISPMAMNLVRLLVIKGRFNLAPEIALHYKELTDQYSGIERAEVVTAIPLIEEERQKLENRLGFLVNKKIIVSQRVDPALIGGMVTKMNGKLLDGSVRTKLETLKKEISGGS
jgi:F-type H+-transporting ATPase subunit delta